MRRLARSHGPALGKEGFGANVTGGAGGTLRAVTNTNDAGAGSLRQAIADANAASPAASIVDIQVGGLITLNSGLTVTGDNITITGRNAPTTFIIRGNPDPLWAGIALTLSGTSSNILVEHLRIYRGLGTGSTVRCLTMFGSNALIRHCSFAWSMDVVISLFDTPDTCTFDYCLFYEPLGEAHHDEGGGFQDHPFGCNFAKPGADPTYEVRASMLRSVMAHFQERMPQCRLQDTEFVNVIGYNWGNTNNGGLIHSDSAAPAPANMIGCLYMQGNNSVIGSEPITGDTAHAVVYINDCIWQKTDFSQDRTAANFIRSGNPKATPNVWTPATPADPTALPVDEMWRHIRPRVGALGGGRSASDIRILKQIDNAVRKVSLDGQIIDSPTLDDHNNVNTNPDATFHSGHANWAAAL